MSTLPAAGTPQTPSTLSLAFIERIRAGVSIEELRELYKFQREIEADANRAAYADDFAKMQGELVEAPKLGVIEMGRGKAQRYARWEDINTAIRPALTKYGFALHFRIEQEAAAIVVTAILTHRLGHSERTTLRLPIDTSGAKNAVQAIGSSVSYGKRYTAGALLNLVSRGEDDDGEALSAEQIEALQAAIVKAGADIARFCGVYGIERIEDLPAGKLAEAMAKLEKFMAQRAAP